jgi:putative ABC transport system ATP-binding protein
MVNHLNLDIQEGEFFVILGPSGSGKSTLLNIIGGLDTSTSGKVIVNGRDISSLSDAELADYRRKTIGFVFQSFNLLPTLSVEENIVMPILMDGRDVKLERLHEIEDSIKHW